MGQDADSGDRSSRHRVSQTRREVLQRGASLAAATAGSFALSHKLPAQADDAAALEAQLAELQAKLAALKTAQVAQTAAAPAPAMPASIAPAPEPMQAAVQPAPAAPTLEAVQPAPAPAAPAVEAVQPVPAPAIPAIEDVQPAPPQVATAASVQPAPAPAPLRPQTKSAYDFSAPFLNEPVPMKKFMGSKASIFVNLKYDDPISQSQMSQFVRLHSLYADQGLHILGFTTNQGWMEPDENTDLRIKFKSAFDFGKYPSAMVFDKADLLGTRALPLWTWLTDSIPNPWGVKRTVFNYEKFLIDKDGQPLRRYPRKYPPDLIEADVKAVLAGRELPPPSVRFEQEWEKAKREASKGEYSFRPGINYFKTGSPGDSGAY